MKIDGKKIAFSLEKILRREVRHLKKKPQLTTILVGESPEQLSYVRIKTKLSKKLNIKFNFIHIKTVPFYSQFMNLIKKHVYDPAVTGIIIQQPLPAQLATDSIYDYISLEKEIEGHKKKSPFCPPLGLAVLTILKYIFFYKKIDEKLFINLKKDVDSFKKIFKNKKVVLVGRGITGGKPIGQTLSVAKINYININSKTINPESYFKVADVIITAAGKKVINPSALKPGVILINVGLRKEGNYLKGDYDEKAIKDIASFYTPTPGGVGPIDVVYLFKNLIDAPPNYRNDYYYRPNRDRENKARFRICSKV